MSGPPNRHNPPTYEEDQDARPNYVYDEEGDAPDIDDGNYVKEDPNSTLAEEEEQDTDEDMARMHQREWDEEVVADARGHEGDIDTDGEDFEVPYDEQEDYRRRLAEREQVIHREEFDSSYRLYGDQCDIKTKLGMGSPFYIRTPTFQFASWSGTS